MLTPRSHVWTRRQRWLIVGAVVVAVGVFSALVYSYERYYRGPNDSVLFGTWRGELGCLGENRTGYRFKPDHTYDWCLGCEDGESWGQAGHWFAGGDFIYLRIRVDEPSGPYDRLEAWHIDSMTSTELRMHYDGLHAALKRLE